LRGPAVVWFDGHRNETVVCVVRGGLLTVSETGILSAGDVSQRGGRTAAGALTAEIIKGRC